MKKMCKVINHNIEDKNAIFSDKPILFANKKMDTGGNIKLKNTVNLKAKAKSREKIYLNKLGRIIGKIL